MSTPAAGGGGGILERIVARQRLEVARARADRPLAELRRAPGYRLERRSLAAALGARFPAIIAECKRRSPSRGVLRESYDPVAIARAYARAGAAAISVLTNAEFFGGRLEDLVAVRTATDVPVLRKDFVIDPYQVEEARAAGADAVLLIVRILTPGELAGLGRLAAELGLETLVEVHDERELEIAASAGATILGINNRDLTSFVTDIATSERLAGLAPPGVRLVAESGLRSAADLRRLHRSGIDAFLIGESFMTAPDPGETLAAMLKEARQVGA